MGVTAAFTGTRHGMTLAQCSDLRTALRDFHVDTLRHGDAVGADAQAHAIGRELGLRIIIHPPFDARLRAWCHGDVVLDPLPYLERNHAMVDASSVLIAAPETQEERLRSGTWATWRYAKSLDREIRLLLP